MAMSYFPFTKLCAIPIFTSFMFRVPIDKKQNPKVQQTSDLLSVKMETHISGHFIS